MFGLILGILLYNHDAMDGQNWKPSYMLVPDPCTRVALSYAAPRSFSSHANRCCTVQHRTVELPRQQRRLCRRCVVPLQCDCVRHMVRNTSALFRANVSTPSAKIWDYSKRWEVRTTVARGCAEIGVRFISTSFAGPRKYDE